MEECVQEFVKMVSENPSLPVICMTNHDVVEEDWGRWASKMGSCWIGEYTIYDGIFYDDRERFMEAYYNSNREELDERFHCFILWDDESYTGAQIKAHDKAERELKAYLSHEASQRFTKAILVKVNSLSFDYDFF